MAKILDWHVAVLNLASKKMCIVNLVKDENGREAWFFLKRKKYLYKSWKIPGTENWVQAMYTKNGNNLILLTDKQVKNLYVACSKET